MKNLKICILFSAVILLSLKLLAQNEEPYSWSAQGLKPLDQIKVHDVGYHDNDSIIRRAQEVFDDDETRIEWTIWLKDVDLSSFEKEEINDKHTLYRLILKSPSAYGIKAWCKNVKLTEGSKLWSYDVERSSFYGPQTADVEVWGTKPYSGNVVIIELLEKKDEEKCSFNIPFIEHRTYQEDWDKKK